MLDYLNTILEQWPTNYQDRAVEVVSLVRNNAALSSQLSCLLVKKVLREKGRGKGQRERNRGRGRKGRETTIFTKQSTFLRSLRTTMSDCVCVWRYLSL